MSLLDFLKRKKDNKKARESSVGEKKPKKKSVKSSDTKVSDAVVKEKKPQTQEEAPKRTTKKGLDFSYEVVREPHISEKATDFAENSQYIFKVFQGYNKKEIKKAVEGVYGVNVLSVNIIKIPAKKRRLGRIQGHKKGYIKAVVKIKEGQKIEIL
jgi:large subunit ribosomal protein L23